MGSYINIGLISKKNRNDFINQCIKLIKSFHEFNAISIKFPKDNKYSIWVEDDMREYTLDIAMKYCYNCDMTEILCNFELEKYYLENVLVRIRHIQEGVLGILFEIPEENNIFQNIDDAEVAIVSFLEKIERLGFEYAFCDNEANIPIRIEQINLDEEYAIFVNYNPNIEVIFATWKIDGLSKRHVY